MPLKDVPKGIEYCLSNGKRLYDDAVLLQKQKKFRTAIPLYILAYEEFGKAVYLYSRHADGEEIEHSEFKSLTRIGSHGDKILMDYSEVNDRLNKMTDAGFEATKAWAAKHGQRWWTVDRQTAININNKSMETLKKLNEVKKRFLYVDYNDEEGEWQMPSQFSDRVLEWLCKYLSYDVLRPYYMTKREMFMLYKGATKHTRLTPELENLLLNSEHQKNLNDLFTTFQSAQFREIIRNAYLAIDSMTKKEKKRSSSA